MTAKTTPNARSTAAKPATKTAPAKARSAATKGRAKAPAVAHPGTAWLALLDAAGLSQTKAAQEMGVAPMTLNRLCNGHGIPTAKVTVLFAKAVGADVHEVWQAVCDYELAQALADTK